MNTSIKFGNLKTNLSIPVLRRHVNLEVYAWVHYRNACRQLRNFSKHRHLHDAISVDRIVKELKEEAPSPVLYYKQGVADSNFSMLHEDTFLLFIMTGFQASLFETFGERIVCLDSTHKTNQYRFKLLTVVVPDEYRNGIYFRTTLYAYI